MTPPLPRRIAGLAADTYGLDPTAESLGPGPAIVFVPGGMDRASGFRRTARHLNQLPVIAIDRRGYAGSIDVAVSDRLSVHAADLAAVCSEISNEVDRDVVVVGHSQGGLIALAAAADRMIDRLVGLVVFEPPMPWFDWYLGSSLALDLGDDPPAAAEFFMRAMIGDRLWERLPEATRQARLAEGPALLADLRASRAPGVAPDLSAVHVATTVGRGSQSRAHHRRAAEVAAHAIPAAELVEVPGANHGVHLSHPREFAQIILDRAASVDPVAGR